MNKVEARNFVSRLILGYIEELFYNDPLVYDDPFKDAEGHRLSKADESRVHEAMDLVIDRMYQDGWMKYEDMLKDYASFTMWERGGYSKVDGKQGAFWTGYDAWRKRQGRTK